MTAETREPSRRFFDLEAWRYFERCSPGQLGRLLLYGLVAAGQSLLLLPVLLLIRYSVDTAIPHKEIGLLVLIGAAIFGLRALNGAVALWLRAAHVRVLKHMTMRLREDLLNRLFLLSRAAYTKLDRDTTHARIVLDTELVPTRPQPRRAFQGWRYLEAADAPPDGKSFDDKADAMPRAMREELRALRLIDW